MSITRVITAIVSRCFGAVMGIPLPGPLASMSISIFARIVGADPHEAEHPMQAYRTIADFFTRRLASGLRPVGTGVVSPVDGTLRAISPLLSSTIEQVKGLNYQLEEFVGDARLAQDLVGGWLINLYLSPKDYHRVHAPLDLEIYRMRHIPGELWPVNDWSLRSVRNLFARNERIVIEAHTALGTLVVVMVGATNVGKMTLAFDPLITNLSLGCVGRTQDYETPIKVKRGAELGTFHLGSTVVLLWKPDRAVGIREQSGKRAVRYGETLVSI